MTFGPYKHAVKNHDGEMIGYFYKLEDAEVYKMCIDNGINYREHCEKKDLRKANELKRKS